LNLSVIEFNSVHLFSAFASDHNTTHDTRKSDARRPIRMSDHAASLFTNREPERRFLFHPTRWIHFRWIQILRKRAFAHVTSIGESISNIFGGKNYAEFSKTRDIFGPCLVVFIQSRKRLS